jgi:hypothetical protein
LNFDLIFFGIVACGAGYFIYSVRRHGGLKGAMFGSRILRSVGEVSLPKRYMVSLKLKVHVLKEKKPGEGGVGLELASIDYWGLGSLVIPMANAEARELIQLLEHASGAEAQTPGEPVD